MSSSGGGISSFIGSKWATVVAVVALATGAVVIPSVTGSSGSSCAQSTPNVPDGPDPWGGCFPGPTTTGVPAGTTLTPMTLAAADSAASVTNAVIDGKAIATTTAGGQPDCVYPTAAGVTIKNSTVRCVRIDSGTAAANTANTRFTIQDSTIDCGGIPQNGDLTGQGVNGQNFNLIRVRVKRCSDGSYSDTNTNITDSFIYPMAWNADPEGIHVDGFQGVGGSNSTLQHNSIITYDYLDPTCTYANHPESGFCNASSAITSNSNSANPAIDNWHVLYNLVGGGSGAVVYCSRPSATNSEIQHNRFMDGYHPGVGGDSAVVDSCGNDGNSATVDEVFSDNLWADGPNAGLSVQ